jgi:hypothetical protein
LRQQFPKRFHFRRIAVVAALSLTALSIATSRHREEPQATRRSRGARKPFIAPVASPPWHRKGRPYEFPCASCDSLKFSTKNLR